MTCERYWREGVVLYERGEIDPHRESCGDCQQAHAACAQMIDALPHVGDDVVGDPMWQSKVLERIDAMSEGAEVIDLAARRRPEPAKDVAQPGRPTWSRWSWWLTGAFAGACAIVCVWLLVGRDSTRRDIDKPGFEIAAGDVAKRGALDRSAADRGELPRTARIFDKLTIAVPPSQEIRVYRANRQIVLRCPTPSPHCRSDEHGNFAELPLDEAGDYQIIFITPPSADPVGNLDGDLAAVVSAGGEYKLNDLSVR
jgi:hypothetical protein